MRIRDDILKDFPPTFVLLTRDNVVRGARVIKNPEFKRRSVPDGVGIIANVLAEKVLIRVKWDSGETILSTLSGELLIEI